MTCSNFDFAKGECCGFTRNFEKGYLQSSRLGYKFQPTPAGTVGIDPAQTIDSYGAHPMAEVAPGGVLVITWQPNNHAFGDGKDGSSPDVTKATIYEGDGSSKKVLTQMDFTNCNGIGGHDAPEQNQSQCSGAWKVDLPEGIHQVTWAWLQNTGESPYTTGFDVKVTKTPSNPICEKLDTIPKKPNGYSQTTGPGNGLPPTGTEEYPPTSSEIPVPDPNPSTGGYTPTTPLKKCNK